MSKSISNYMNAQPVTIAKGVSLIAIIAQLSASHVSGAPVIDEQKNIVGFVSEQDCLKQLLLGSYHCDQTAVVDDVMRTDVLTVHSSDSIIELAQQMSENKPKIYPVVDNDKLVGVINRQHILQGLTENQQHCGAW